MTPDNSSTTTLQGVVVVALVEYQARHKAWGWLRLAQGQSALQQVPGLRFAKVMGSGHQGGFSIRPSSTHQGLITMFEDAASAQAFVQGPLIAAYRERARQFWTGLMCVDSARGAWDGRVWGNTPAQALGALTDTLDPSNQIPLAVITRASIRPAKALAFWRYAPASQTDLQNAPGCTMAMGLGEAPLLRQCTFSLWRNTPSMLAYAHGGAHQAALEAAYRHDFFAESLFVRMRLLEQQGHWQTPGQPSPAASA
jgi:spheroidene monooxygenase